MAADTKTNPPGNLTTPISMTRYELLMRLNSDWIAKQNNKQQA